MGDILSVTREVTRFAVAETLKTLSPASDEIKQREAHRWLKTLGLKPCDLAKMESEGLIHGRRKGKADNSPIIYSKSEILSAIGMKNLQKMIQ